MIVDVKITSPSGASCLDTVFVQASDSPAATVQAQAIMDARDDVWEYEIIGTRPAFKITVPGGARCQHWAGCQDAAEYDVPMFMGMIKVCGRHAGE